MKILYHHRIASKDGQYVHVEELINAFRKFGHEVVIVGPRVVEREPFGSAGGLVTWLKQNLPLSFYELLELTYSMFALGRLIIAFLKHQPDFIYERYNLYLPSGVWLKKIFKVPLLLEVNAPLFEERSKYNGLALRRLARWTERFCWRGADYVLPVSEVLAEYVRKVGINKEQIVVIHNGVNLERFCPDSGEKAKKQLALQGKLVLGFVGFMREWHGLEKLVPMLTRLGWQDVHLLLVGDGPARQGISMVAQQEGVEDRVTITGVVSREQVPFYIAAFDIALQPDVVDYASPLKLFEYMAMGKAIVAPAKRNIQEILTDQGNGLLFVDGSNGLIKQVERFVEDASLRMQCAKVARDTIFSKGFTWSSNAEKIIELARAVKCSS